VVTGHRTAAPADRGVTLADLQRTLTALSRRVVVPRVHERIVARAGVDIELVEAVALARIVDQDALRLSELARQLGVGCSTAGRHAGRLAHRGLCRRAPDPADARAVVVTPTAQGRAVVARLRAAHRDVLAEQLHGWSDADLATLVALAGRLVDDLDVGLPDASDAAALAPSPTDTEGDREAATT
jgi:DNA-binding MarR family transcriptional regulator